MVRTEVIIGVKDVEKSSRWYQHLLGCESKHGGHTFEVLADKDGTVILCLHKWDEHNHPTLIKPKGKPGNGLILYLRVSDIRQIWKNAMELNVTIEEEPHINRNTGKEEFSLRDIDGYYVIISA